MMACPLLISEEAVFSFSHLFNGTRSLFFLLLLGLILFLCIPAAIKIRNQFIIGVCHHPNAFPFIFEKSLYCSHRNFDSRFSSNLSRQSIPRLQNSRFPFVSFLPYVAQVAILLFGQFSQNTVNDIMNACPASANHNMIAIIFLRDDFNDVAPAIQLDTMFLPDFFTNRFRGLQLLPN